MWYNTMSNWNPRPFSGKTKEIFRQLAALPDPPERVLGSHLTTWHQIYFAQSSETNSQGLGQKWVSNIACCFPGIWVILSPMLGNNASYEDSFTTCQITPNNHRSLFDSLFQHAASITESLLRIDCCWVVCFLQGLLTHPLQHALWLPPAPSQNFRGTFAKISLFTDPGHQQVAHWRKSEHQGPWAWLSQSLTFGDLAAPFGACFLRLQKSSLGSDSGRCKDVLQDHGVWLSRGLTFGSSAATCEGQSDCPKASPHRELKQNQTEILRCPSPAGPQAAVGGSPLHNDYNIQLSRNFREKNVTFANSKKLSRGFPT